jgi:hypothetical protein
MSQDRPLLEIADFMQAHMLEEILQAEGIAHRIEPYSYAGSFPGSPRPWTYGNYGRLWAFAEDEERILELFVALQEAEILLEDEQLDLQIEL